MAARKCSWEIRRSLSPTLNIFVLRRRVGSVLRSLERALTTPFFGIKRLIILRMGAESAMCLSSMSGPILDEPIPGDIVVARYGKKAQSEVKRAVHKEKKGNLHSGKAKKSVKSRKQAIAIGLSKARKKGAKVPKKR